MKIKMPGIKIWKVLLARNWESLKRENKNKEEKEMSAKPPAWLVFPVEEQMVVKR